MVKPEFRFDEVHVVSDLHLGGEVPSRQIFRRGDLLAALIDSLAARPAARSIALVVNGDVVDFLAEPDARYLDPEGAVGKLERILSDARFEPVWQALRRFVAKIRRTLVLNLGNHDLELALPWVRRRLVEEISGGDDRHRGRIEVTFDGTGFLCAVGRASVLCLHGNEVDTWNVTDHERLRRLGWDRQLGLVGEPWAPNAGTRLVVDVLNEVKREYAFVDLLKPEAQAVVPILLALKPELAAQAGAAIEVGAQLTYDWLRRRTGFLSGSMATSSDPLLAELAGEAFQARSSPAGEVDVDHLLRQVEEHLEAGREPIDFVAAEDSQQQLGKIQALFDFARGKKAHQVVREGLESLQRGRHFDIRTVDTTFRALDRLVAPEVDFLVASHSHLERTLPRTRGGGYYFNSGTWTRLIELRPELLADDKSFKPVWDVLAAGSMTALDGAGKLELVREKPAVVSIVDRGDVVEGTLNRVQSGAHLEPVGDRFERN